MLTEFYSLLTMFLRYHHHVHTTYLSSTEYFIITSTIVNL